MKLASRETIKARLLLDTEWANSPLGELAQFMMDNNLTTTFVGKQLNVSHRLLYRWLTSNNKPGRKVDVILRNEAKIMSYMGGRQ